MKKSKPKPKPEPEPKLEPKHTYKLKFVPPALDEWNRLDGSVKEPLRKLLKKRLDSPHVDSARLHGTLSHCYKIKLLKQGYRLVYTVIDHEVVVLVLAVDKRADHQVYLSATRRIRLP